MLYREAKKLGISIENKRFVRMHEDSKAPGIIVANNLNEEEIIQADYVFDCTGARREVVNAMNNVVPNSPLQLTLITEFPVKNHFLAYVKISKNDWAQFKKDNERIEKSPESLDSLSFVQSIMKLRAMEWSGLMLYLSI
ncbi:MAG: hypothetical protein QM652_08420 [Legionella sp.]|uniref:hypothetical protein n=1 Tax=Legionella sp. TaxID=459 RepID=UPI0039E3BC97